MGKVIVWWTRLAWVALGVVGSVAWGDALATRADAVRLTAAIGGWALWGLALAAMAALSTLSLTLARLTVSLALPAQIVVAVDTPGVWAVVAVALAATCVVTAMSAEFARACVQASAYGAEERFPLRPPAPFLAPMVLAWAVLATAWLLGPLSLAAGRWALGLPVSAVAAVLTVVLGRRFHRMTRRWLVMVPAGVVVHDPLLLAETLLLRRNVLEGVRLASGDPEAVALTGLTWGTAVQIDAREPQVVIPHLPRTTDDQPSAPRPIRVRSIVVAPSRPGQVLVSARRARLA